MHSLASIVAAQGSVLVLDTATTRVQAGLLCAGQPSVWHTGGDDSSVHLFLAAQACLAARGLRPTQVGAFAYCDGPGSQLGIRTACMALRTWQTLRAVPAPVFAYRSLTCAALAHQCRHGGAPFAVIADARREHWHAVRTAAEGTASPVLRVTMDELRAWPEPLLTPAGFRAWSTPPRPAAACAYDLAGFWTLFADAPVLTAVPEPEPWLSAAIEYKAWTGQRHRGPSAPASAP